MIKSINRIVKTLIGADIIFLSAMGLIAPIFAIFVTQHIKGGDIKVAGFAAGIYLITKSILELPIGRFLDKTKGEKDDLYCLVIGYLIVACVPFGYALASYAWHIYVLQGFYALGIAMAWPSWCAIFTRHIDKGKEALEWGLQDTSYGFGAGIAGAIGGILVAKFGFDVVFIIVGIIALMGALLPLIIHKEITKGDKNYFRFLRRR